jgi:hypothetical protein
VVPGRIPLERLEGQRCRAQRHGGQRPVGEERAQGRDRGARDGRDENARAKSPKTAGLEASTRAGTSGATAQSSTEAPRFRRPRRNCVTGQGPASARSEARASAPPEDAVNDSRPTSAGGT